MAPPGTVVLRGGSFAGVSHLSNLRKVYEAYGIWGICCAAEPGSTADEIGGYGKFGNRTMMVGVSDELSAEGFTVIQEPGKAWPDALITFPDEPTTKDWEYLRAVFERRPMSDNPSYKGK